MATATVPKFATIGQTEARAEPLPIALAELFAFEPWGGQGYDFIERRLFARLRDLGAVHFRSTGIYRQWERGPAGPGYPIGLYAEGWRVAPADITPPHRAGPFFYPLNEAGEPIQSGSAS